MRESQLIEMKQAMERVGFRSIREFMLMVMMREKELEARRSIIEVRPPQNSMEKV